MFWCCPVWPSARWRDCILQCLAAYTILRSRLRLYLQCLTAYIILISRLKMYFTKLCCSNHVDVSTETYFAMICCSHHLDISTETVFCNVMLPTASWCFDWDCILQCYAAYSILMFRLRLYFALPCCLHHLDISTETVFCNAMLPTESWYIVWNCILKCYAAYTILMSRLRLHLTMLCCLHNLDISYETVVCKATLLKPHWYPDWDCILLYYAAYTILRSRP